MELSPSRREHARTVARTGAYFSCDFIGGFMANLFIDGMVLVNGVAVGVWMGVVDGFAPPLDV